LPTSRNLVAGLGLLGALVLAAAPARAVEGQVAILQGLDKVTARVSTFEAPIDEPVTFGSLEVTARYCDEAPPEEPPESKVFLEIVDLKPDADPQPVFTGWMFASSPAVSALEHPVYDVWVLDCRITSSADKDAGKSE
jgi:hypothetical protein